MMHNFLKGISPKLHDLCVCVCVCVCVFKMFFINNNLRPGWNVLQVLNNPGFPSYENFAYKNPLGPHMWATI